MKEFGGVDLIRGETQIEDMQSRHVLEKVNVQKLSLVTAPSVLNGTVFELVSTTPVSVIDFLNGAPGQRIYLLGDGFTTIQNGVNIFTSTGADKLLTPNTVYTFTFFEIPGPPKSHMWVEDCCGSGGGGSGQQIIWSLNDPSGTASDGSLWFKYNTHHRYWRILILQVFTGSVSSCSECEMNEVIGGPDVTGSGTPSANSTNGGFVPANAFDNNNATFWASNSVAFPHWLKYDFGVGSEKQLVEITWRNRSDGFANESPRTFDVQFSDDDLNWRTVQKFSNLPNWTVGEKRAFSFSAVINVINIWRYNTSTSSWELLIGVVN